MTKQKIFSWFDMSARRLCCAVLSLTATVASAAISLPNINTNNIILVTGAPYNAVGDGVTTNTTAIQNAINAASAGGTTNGLSGGTVEIPAGIFLSGPLAFKSKVNLQLDDGAILRMLPYDKYPGGIVNPASFITGTSLTDIEISGPGAFDGQGAPWWPGYKTNNRPTMISFSKCTRVLFQDTTFSNSPAQHIGVKGTGAGNVTIRRISVIAPASSLPAAQASHNTDAIDLAETNCIVQDCYLNVGDDNVAMGSSAGLSRDILITNCVCGTGHGISIGSFTSSGVSNITVINCTFNGTDNPIRIKSDNDRGGTVQNLSYLNLGMTNVNFAAMIIYGYYNEVGIPTNISPATAVAQGITNATGTMPVFRNITISNITATVAADGIAGIIWGRTELPATNIVLSHVNITAARSFDVYNAYGIQLLDCRLTNTTGSQKTLTIWNAGITASNTVSGAGGGVVTIDGTNVNYGMNSLALFNSKASMLFTNALGANPITVNASTLTAGNNLFLPNTTTLNFTAGTSNSQIATTGNLNLDSLINVSAGAGFTNGSYTLFTYGSTLDWGPPTLGNTPAGFNYSFDTNTPGQVNLLVQLPPPAAPTNFIATPSNALVKLSWSASSGATGYNLKRATTNGGPYSILAPDLTSTNFNDANVTNGVTYFYVVSALGSGGESANSVQVSATPAPSLSPVNLLVQNSSGQLTVSWPADHTGWRLEIQTNSLATGIGNNWITMPDSIGTNQISIPIVDTNPAVFLRLTYP
jgi:hypothetical protein